MRYASLLSACKNNYMYNKDTLIISVLDWKYKQGGIVATRKKHFKCESWSHWNIFFMLIPKKALCYSAGSNPLD